MQYTDALTKRMTLLEQQNEHILKQLELFGKTINPSNFMTPQPPHNLWYLHPWFHAGDIYNPSMPVNRDIYTPSTPVTNMQSRPSYIPLPTSTPSRVTRLPLSTLLTPNQEISDNAPSTPSTGELSPFRIGPSNQSPSSASAVSSSSNDSTVTISVSSSSSGSNSTVIILSTSTAKDNKSPSPIPFAELISPQTVVEKY